MNPSPQPLISPVRLLGKISNKTTNYGLCTLLSKYLVLVWKSKDFIFHRLERDLTPNLPFLLELGSV